MTKKENPQAKEPLCVMVIVKDATGTASRRFVITLPPTLCSLSPFRTIRFVFMREWTVLSYPIEQTLQLPIAHVLLQLCLQ